MTTPLLSHEDTYRLASVAGRLCAVWPDGKTLPIIRGGDGPEGEGGDGEGNGEGSEGGDEGDGEDEGSEGGDDKVELTQAEIDAMVAKRVEIKLRKAQKDEAAKAERDKLDEAARLKAEKADAEKARDEATAKADARVIAAEAKVAAVDAGVKADRVATFLRLVDLENVTVDDDGEVDTKALKAAIDKALKTVPEFKGEPAKGGASGGEHGGPRNERAKTIEDAVQRRLAS